MGRGTPTEFFSRPCLLGKGRGTSPPWFQEHQLFCFEARKPFDAGGGNDIIAAWSAARTFLAFCGAAVSNSCFFLR